MKSLLLAALLAAPAYAQDDAAPAAEPTEEAADLTEGEDAAGSEEKEESEKEETKKVELPAVEVPTDDAAAIEDVQEAVNALQMGQWATFVVLLLGLLGFAYNKFAGWKSDAPAKSE